MSRSPALLALLAALASPACSAERSASAQTPGGDGPAPGRIRVTLTLAPGGPRTAALCGETVEELTISYPNGGPQIPTHRFCMAAIVPAAACFSDNTNFIASQLAGAQVDLEPVLPFGLSELDAVVYSVRASPLGPAGTDIGRRLVELGAMRFSAGTRGQWPVLDAAYEPVETEAKDAMRGAWGCL